MTWNETETRSKVFVLLAICPTLCSIFGLDTREGRVWELMVPLFHPTPCQNGQGDVMHTLSIATIACSSLYRTPWRRGAQSGANLISSLGLSEGWKPPKVGGCRWE